MNTQNLVALFCAFLLCCAGQLHAQATQGRLLEEFVYLTEQQTQKIKEDALSGSADAQFKWALLRHEQYLWGGDKTGARDAFNFLTKSVDQGKAEAHYWLGRYYLEGVAGVVDPDVKRALSLFEAGSNKGDVRSKGALGREYLSGEISNRI